MSNYDYEGKANLSIQVLVRQAKAGQTIVYSKWGEEIGAPNRGVQGKILDEMGQQLCALSASNAWKHPRIPVLGTLVVNKGKKQPELFKVEKFLPKDRRSDAGVAQEQQDAFNYEHWDKVLSALGLKPLPPLVD